MMINNKNSALIVLLLVLVALPRNTESFFSRLKKRSTDDGMCEQSSAAFCSKIITDETGILSRFNPNTSQQIQNFYANATSKCKVLLCLTTLYTVVIEGEKHFPNLFLINDESFVNAIKSTNLTECNDNKNNQNSIDVTTTNSNSIIIDYDKLKSDITTVDFNHLSETTVTQQDTQSIKSNEIDGSLNESKQTTKKGIIDILYTNENYTDAAKSKDVNEQSDRKLAKNKYQGKEYVSVVNLGNQLAKDQNESSMDPFLDEGSGDERPAIHIDVANKISYHDSNTNSITDSSDLDFSSVTTAPLREPTDLAFMESSSDSKASSMESDTLSVSTSSLEGSPDFLPTDLSSTSTSGLSTSSDSSNGKIEKIASVSISESSTSSDSAEDSSIESFASNSEISKIKNVVFQLLGETGYNTFSCNLSTTDDDNSFNENLSFRRLGKLEGKLQPTIATYHNSTNDTLERIEFQPIDNNALPKIPENLYADHRIRKIFVKLNIFDLCNFTRDDQQNWTDKILTKLNLCSEAITTLKIDVDGKLKTVLEQFSMDIQNAAKKLKTILDSKVKVIRIINLTDYLSSTIKVTDIPKDHKSNFDELKQFLLVELRNEDLKTFHPDSNRKDVFMMELFDFLIRSEIVDFKNKKLLETFKKYIHSNH